MPIASIGRAAPSLSGRGQERPTLKVCRLATPREPGHTPPAERPGDRSAARRALFRSRRYSSDNRRSIILCERSRGIDRDLRRGVRLPATSERPRFINCENRPTSAFGIRAALIGAFAMRRTDASARKRGGSPSGVRALAGDPGARRIAIAQRIVICTASVPDPDERNVVIPIRGLEATRRCRRGRRGSVVAEPAGVFIGLALVGFP